MVQGLMQALAMQIAALVQQLQDFYEGYQDPITWLEDIEKAFDANMVSDN
ncbi:13163_t:CDS:2 [Cetraspora pellucida]|uniref:13163_t:CDS:1 n=1 Tax=Cetraspora pellucida TaxID=1433469 RepID=A0A9N8WRH9_9GLOM|nr:13163_t:CDS:2 [Cetraspora pellucida]